MKLGDLKWFSSYPEVGIVYSQKLYKDYLKDYLSTLHNDEKNGRLK